MCAAGAKNFFLPVCVVVRFFDFRFLDSEVAELVVDEFSFP